MELRTDKKGVVKNIILIIIIVSIIKYLLVISIDKYDVLLGGILIISVYVTFFGVIKIHNSRKQVSNLVNKVFNRISTRTILVFSDINILELNYKIWMKCIQRLNEYHI